MKNYETIFISKADLTVEKIQSLIEKISSVIKQNGEIISVNDWGKRRLAYTISGYKEGNYVYIEFKADTKVIKELDKVYRFTEDILRFLTVKSQKIRPIFSKNSQATSSQKQENLSLENQPLTTVERKE